MIMVLAGPIILFGLAMLPDQKIHLAAYSVAEAMAILIESPIIMLLQASTALSRDPLAYHSLKRFMYQINLGLTLLYAVLAFTPLYDLIFSGWLGQPPAVAAAARPAFQVMLLWPAAIGWRRFYQGLLIAHKRSGKVGLASIFRLASLAVTVAIGTLLRLPGALVAGLGLVVSVLVEAAAVTFYAERELRHCTWEGTDESLPHTVGGAARWYAPLGLTAVLIWASKPALNAGLARAGEADLSLAAWPAIWTTMMLVANAIRMVQQLVIKEATTPENHVVLRRFTISTGVAASLVMSLIAFSPAGGSFLRVVTGLTGDLAAVSLPALKIGMLYPLGVALQNHLQGLLIRVGRTQAVNLAALLGSGVLFATMIAGVRVGGLGTVVGVTAVMIGQVVEVLFLYGLTRQERAKLAPLVTAHPRG